jgi:hypothetical protein
MICVCTAEGQTTERGTDLLLAVIAHEGHLKLRKHWQPRDGVLDLEEPGVKAEEEPKRYEKQKAEGWGGQGAHLISDVRVEMQMSDVTPTKSKGATVS